MKVDATGLSCPQPVILLNQAINSGEKEIDLFVDCGAGYENTKRLALSKGYDVVNETCENGLTTMKLIKKS